MTFTFTSRVGVRDDEFARAGNDDEFFLTVLDVTHRRGEAYHAGVLGFNAGSNRRTACRTTDVERTHRKLRARFTDGLSGDDAHGLTGVHKRAASEITAVALRAQTVAGVAGERRTDLHGIHAFGIELIADVFVNEHTGFNEHFLVVVVDGFSRHTAQHAVAQRLNDFAAFNERTHHNAVSGAAVVFNHNQVLRHVYETAGEVTGVSGL